MRQYIDSIEDLINEVEDIAGKISRKTGKLILITFDNLETAVLKFTRLRTMLHYKNVDINVNNLGEVIIEFTPHVAKMKKFSVTLEVNSNCIANKLDLQSMLKERALGLLNILSVVEL